jgi:uncharacterized protein YgiB involved in biofilm formation
MSKLRRSKQIVLVWIGAAALPACTPAPPRAVHDRYASLEDCTADWGRPEVCDQDNDSRPGWGNGGGPLFFYRGPSYPEGDRGPAQLQARTEAIRLGALDPAGPSIGSHAIAQSVPTRGGFGASAHVFGGRG